MVVSLALVATVALGQLGEPRKKTDAAQAFERLKNLVGRWEATNEKGQKVGQTYELISGGTALLERFVDPSSEHTNMITVYHLDGEQLMLTHYCAANNQPRMRAERYDLESWILVFEFLDATNLANPSAGHMRRAVYRFLDKSRFTTEWTFYKEGKPAFTEVLHFARPTSETAPASQSSIQSQKEKNR